MSKKLYRSNSNTVLFGVIGGVGEYYDIDPTILRLAFIIIVLMSGVFPAIVAYIIAAMIVPKKPIVHYSEHTTPKDEEKKEEPKSE